MATVASGLSYAPNEQPSFPFITDLTQKDPVDKKSRFGAGHGLEKSKPGSHQNGQLSAHPDTNNLEELARRELERVGQLFGMLDRLQQNLVCLDRPKRSTHPNKQTIDDLM